MEYIEGEYNFIIRKLHPNWAGWQVIDEQRKKPNFPDNLKDRKELLDDLEYSYKNKTDETK